MCVDEQQTYSCVCPVGRTLAKDGVNCGGKDTVKIAETGAVGTCPNGLTREVVSLWRSNAVGTHPSGLTREGFAVAVYAVTDLLLF